MASYSLHLLLYARGRNKDGETVSSYISFADPEKMNTVLTQAYLAIESGDRQTDGVFCNWVVTHAQLMIEKFCNGQGVPLFNKDEY